MFAMADVDLAVELLCQLEHFLLCRLSLDVAVAVGFKDIMRSDGFSARCFSDLGSSVISSNMAGDAAQKAINKANFSL